MNPYLDKLVEEWDKGFNEQLNSSLEKFNIFFAIIIVLLVLIHVLFVENFIIAKLNH